MADYCFAPTATEEKILLSEGIPREKIHVTGNTIVDAVKMFAPTTAAGIVDKLGLTRKKYYY